MTLQQLKKSIREELKELTEIILGKCFNILSLELKKHSVYSEAKKQRERLDFVYENLINLTEMILDQSLDKVAETMAIETKIKEKIVVAKAIPIEESLENHAEKVAIEQIKANEAQWGYDKAKETQQQLIKNFLKGE